MSEIGDIHDLPSAQRVHQASTARKEAEPQAEFPRSEEADRAEFSDYARLLSRLSVLPEIRVEKVAAARAEIEAGTYLTPEKLDVAIERALRDLTD